MIGRALNGHGGSIHGVLAVAGDIEPHFRVRLTRALQMREREEISRGLRQDFSLRYIVKLLH